LAGGCRYVQQRLAGSTGIAKTPNDEGVFLQTAKSRHLKQEGREATEVKDIRPFKRIERLAVAPNKQGCGVGTALMRAAETRFPAANRFELFTGHKSAKNLRLYQKLGYREFKRKQLAPHITLVFLQKERPAH
jgi:GNAT superfamily N-acetyltransferase